ncbi:hypothetical protein VW35_16450 [Devosia soli]|uniref:CobQ/CobB/MinD/ParA nucleotide binding domain-containing protein n=1 Tax=Devosia soli TaxID=361041 RepID=A0A0F5L3U5_9HYPH|nr:division plane positioning ATPase MipZ [Devosia soli]KKB76900.1 hypothetical protein VW35_16450 [Devosia soli]
MLVITSAKGGTGKSNKAVVTVTTLRSLGQQVAVYDADASVSSTYLALRIPDVPEDQQDPLLGAVRYDMRDPEEAETFIRSMDSGVRTIIHDFPGGAHASVAELFPAEYSNGLGEIAELAADYGYRLTIMHMKAADPSYEASFHTLADGFGDGVDFVAVLNRGLMTDQNLSNWTASGARSRLFELGGREITLPALAPSLLQYGLKGIADEAVITDPYHRQLRRLFLRKAEQELNAITNWLF